MGVRKIARVAWREFASTALTKGFIIGALATPVLILVMISLVALLAATKSEPTVTGEVAIIDPTGQVAARLADQLSPEALAQAAQERADRITEALEDVSGGAGGLASSIGPSASKFATLRVVELDSSVDIDAEKQRVREEASVDDGRLALVVIHPQALEPQDEAERQDLDLFVRPKLDDDVSDDIRDTTVGIIRDERFKKAGYDREKIAQLRNVRAGRPTELTEDGGERASLGEFNSFIAYGFMMLMLIPTFIGAQYLLTNSIEEKSSRVVEILLSAVSPMQLMTGKVVGQMFVGLVIMLMYGGMSIIALVRFGLGDSVTPLALVAMFVFFALAYFTFASFMAAVGSSVNELREAQSLVGPVMIPLMLPYGLGFLIADDPNSTFATIASFAPPIAPFMMMLRVASTTPPPLWQVGLAMLISLATCVVAVWFAAKVFRVGLLMYGKPPNFRTLVKWVRMA